MSQVIELSEQDFESVVLKSEVPVLVDFWSPSCGPCRIIAPMLDELAVENEGDAKIVKINTFENMDIAARYGVDMLPTLMVFNRGHVVERMIGAVPKDRLQSALDEVI
ncbi:MAG: thioredoxin [Planctomycetaceae bacterium]|nr:thioredoxin [Planctomycetaceae bacterium]